MRKFSPKLILSGGTALLLVFGATYYAYQGNQDAEPQGVIDVDVEELLSRDSDQDGLFDWEEEIFGTDSYLVDSDGDGTSDKEEINQQRDPLVAGPDDQISQEDFRNHITKDKNLTHSLFESMLPGTLLVADQRLEGGEVTDDQLASLSEVNQGEIFNLEDQYSQAQVNIDKDLTMESYGEEMFNLITSYESSDIGQEADIFSQVASGGVTNLEPGKIEAVAESYQSLAQDIIETPSMSQTVSWHQDLANNYWNIGETVAAFSEIGENDPMSGLLLSQLYQDLVFQRDDILNNYSNFFSKNL